MPNGTATIANHAVEHDDATESKFLARCTPPPTTWIGFGHRVRRLGRTDKGWSWPQEVATRLQRTATEVGQRERPVTHQVASEIRMAALCLAVEADLQADPGNKELAALFRHIAVTITLLEGRVHGWVPAPETIILATA
jgi:hypothetical protein